MNIINLFKEKYLFLDTNFIYSSKEGDIEKIKEYNDFIYIENKEKFVNYLSSAVTQASENNHVEIVKYLLTNEKFKLYRNSMSKGLSLMDACKNDCVDVVKFLLTEFGWVTEKNKYQVVGSAIDFAVRSGSMKILEYIIFDYDVKEGEYIKFMKTEEHSLIVENLFERKKLNNKLQKELKDNNKVIVNVKKI